MGGRGAPERVRCGLTEAAVGRPRLGVRDGRRSNPAAVRCGSPVGRRREGRRWDGGHGVTGGGVGKLAGGRADTSTGEDRAALGRMEKNEPFFHLPVAVVGNFSQLHKIWIRWSTS
jgi:hypothetical protein